MNRPRSLAGYCLGIALCLAIALLHPGAAAAAEEKEWHFNVFLDDAEIGYHRFRLIERGDGQRLESEARFNVKFLFFDAYSYRHENVEVWRGNCLRRIAAETNDNGEAFSVRGAVSNDRFIVATADGSVRLPQCVMTFAYWNPDFLGQSHLLNAQTGDYLGVTVTTRGVETITVRDQPVNAYRYLVEAKGFRIELWYSADNRWLALESTTEGGRRLRYVLR